MKVFGLVKFTEFEDCFGRTEWIPDFDYVELYLDEKDRDKRLVELNGEQLTDIVMNPTAESHPGYISLDHELDKYRWEQYRPDQPPCSFKNLSGEPVKGGPYVPFCQDIGREPNFKWQTNAGL